MVKVVIVLKRVVILVSPSTSQLSCAAGNINLMKVRVSVMASVRSMMKMAVMIMSTMKVRVVVMVRTRVKVRL